MTGCKVGGIVLPHGPYMIGAGVCKTPAETKKWLKVAPSISGSITPNLRDINTGKVFYPETLEDVRHLGYGLNSFGMPNMGFDEAEHQLTRIESEQPLIVSLAGFSIDDYVRGVMTFSNLRNIAAIELNFGCPNTQGEHPDIMSFNPGAIRKLLENLSSLTGGCRKPIWLKFSPYSNPAELKRMAELVNEFKDDLVLAVVTCNTFADGYAGDGKIDPNGGQGGLSGPAIKQISRGQVKRFREYLDLTIDVIGVGGIMSGDDIVEFLDAGAKAVQMTTWPFWAGNPGRFMDELTNSQKFLEYLDLNHSES